MILLEQTVGTAHTASHQHMSHEGSTTVIILEPDGSLRHYPPPGNSRRARVELSADAVDADNAPSIFDKLIDFTFDVLGLSKLEVRVYEHPQP